MTPISVKLAAGTVGQRLRLHRDRCGMTQDELAARTGISRSQIANIEVGRGEPSMPVFIACVRALGVSADTLITEPDCAGCQDMPPPGFTCNACGLSSEDAGS